MYVSLVFLLYTLASRYLPASPSYLYCFLPLFFRLFVRRRIFGLLRAFKVFHIVFPGALVVLQRQLGMTWEPFSIPIWSMTTMFWAKKSGTFVSVMQGYSPLSENGLRSREGHLCRAEKPKRNVRLGCETNEASLFCTCWAEKPRVFERLISQGLFKMYFSKYMTH